MGISRLSQRIKDRIASLPNGPGVYLFKERGGRSIYIGKALSLRKRVMGHFRFYGETFSKEGVMLKQVERIDFIETPSEAEALLLESSLVKESLPKYNAELKDDKSYPFLKITDEEYPRLLVTRGRKADGGRYFGPYTSGKLLHEAVKMLRREFPLRTCKKMPKKLCLMYHIGQCGGPCESKEEHGHYLSTARDLTRFLEGRRDALVKNLTRRMKQHAARREYEKAQNLFEEIKALATVPSTNRVRDDAGTLKDLQKALSLPVFPARIEGFDISNLSGRESVGSMVVFLHGRPARSEYRRFRVKTVAGIDDYKMMQEVIRRRFTRAIEEKQRLADLVVIDGGKGHLSAAKTVLDGLGLSALPVISIAKQHEHLFSVHRDGPYIFPQSSPFLELIRHLRDEAHRFAITYHRRLHKKEAIRSELDGIPGVGPKTREKILKRIGPPSKIRSLAKESLAREAGINEKTAHGILEALQARPEIAGSARGSR